MTTPWQAFIDAELPAADTPYKRARAIADALDMVPPPSGARLLSVPRLVLPCGEWSLEPVVGNACVRIPDHRHVDLDLNGSGLLVPPGAVGVLLPFLAGRSCVRGGVVAGADPSDISTTGVLVEGPLCTVERVQMRELGRGLDVCAGVAEGKNANGTRVLCCEMDTCDEAARIRGTDSNGGLFAGNAVLSCRIGLVDESALGNAHIGWLFEAVAEHTLWVGQRDSAWYGASAPWDEEAPGRIPLYGSNFSTYTHTHVEQGCGSQLPGYTGAVHPLAVDTRRAPYSTFVGGNAVPLTQNGDRIGYGYSRLMFRERAPDGSVAQVNIPDVANAQALRAFYTSRRGGPPVSRRQLALGWRDAGAGYPKDAGLYAPRNGHEGVDFNLGPVVAITDEQGPDTDDVRINAPGAHPAHLNLAGRKIP